MIIETWNGCYDDQWKGYITEAAFQHPAKFARGLIEKIYEYMIDQKMISVGDTVVDPFGGIGTGGVMAASYGLQWIGVELEPKFFHLALANFELHRVMWERFGDPMPRIVCGDSRKLRVALGSVFVEATVSSPPFSGTEQPCASQTRTLREGGYEAIKAPTKRDATLTTETPGQLGAMETGDVDAVVGSPPFLDARSDTTPSTKGATAPTKHDPEAWAGAIISSPPYAECLTGDNTAKETAEESRAKRITPGGSLGQSCRHSGYGGPGNLGNLPAGEVDAVVSSPPYAQSNQDYADGFKYIDLDKTKGISNGSAMLNASYGDTAGQLGQMPAGDVDGVVSSPPYEGIRQDGGRIAKEGVGGFGAYTDEPPDYWHTQRDQNNLGNLKTGDTFWEAAKLIVIECHAILKPGGWSAWVVKDFIRDKQRVAFCDDWCRLLEACGFTVERRIRAMLVKEQRHVDLFGGEQVKKTERKSFFRRLYEKKYPENSIDFEEVIFARKSF